MLTIPEIRRAWEFMFFLAAITLFSFTRAADENIDAPQSTASSTMAKASSSLGASPSKTSSAQVRTYTVEVGKADHKFRPDVIQAAVGDVGFILFLRTEHEGFGGKERWPCADNSV